MPIGVDGLDWSRFRDGNLIGIAIQRGAAAEDQGVTRECSHHVDEADAASHIHLPVAKRISHGFAHGLQPCEVDHALNGLTCLFRFSENLFEDKAVVDRPWHGQEPFRAGFTWGDPSERNDAIKRST